MEIVSTLLIAAFVLGMVALPVFGMLMVGAAVYGLVDEAWHQIKGARDRARRARGDDPEDEG